MNVSRALRVTAFALAALTGGSALAAGGPALVVDVEYRPRPACGAGHRPLVSGLDHQADDRLCRPRQGALGPSCRWIPPDGHRQRRRPAALQDGLQAWHGDPARQRAQDHDGQVGERRRRDHRREYRRLDRRLRGADERPCQPPRHARAAISPTRTACPTTATRPRPATWRSSPARCCASSRTIQDLFHIGAIQFGRRIMRNTNGLIGRYPGADGMKTGFICSAGFNVVASATRDGRRPHHGRARRAFRQRAHHEGGGAVRPRLQQQGELHQSGTRRPCRPRPCTPPDMRAVICDRRGPVPGGRGRPPAVSAETDSACRTSSPPRSWPSRRRRRREPVRTVLGPRAAVQPERVWIGLNPPCEADFAAQAAAEECRRAGPQGQEQEGDRAKKESHLAGHRRRPRTMKRQRKACEALPRPRKPASVAVKPVTAAPRPADKPPQGRRTKKATAKPKPRRRPMRPRSRNRRRTNSCSQRLLETPGHRAGRFV